MISYIFVTISYFSFLKKAFPCRKIHNSLLSHFILILLNFKLVILKQNKHFLIKINVFKNWIATFISIWTCGLHELIFQVIYKRSY